jgi:hypothetical protein
MEVSEAQELPNPPYVGRACPEFIPSTREGARGIYPPEVLALSHLSLGTPRR